MPSDNEKPHKKSSGPKFSQSSPIGSVFRFGKRRVSETSQAWSRSASESTTDSPTNEQSYSSIPQGEYVASPTGEDSPGPYFPQSAVRLVNTQRPSGVDSNVDSMGDDVNPVVDVVQPIIQSPESMSPQPPTSSTSISNTQPTSSRRTRSDISPPPSRTSTPIPTTPRVHWNQLRNAIIPGASAPSSVRSFVPDAMGSTLPPRPQTPKPSRFARLGFRQVVEQTREVAHNEFGRFEAEVHQACTVARFGDPSYKVEKEGPQSVLLPFVSTSSLSLSATAVSQASKSSQFSDLPARTTSSLKLLHQTLIRYASTSAPTGTAMQLPFEADVLSVLLMPFTMESGPQAEERWLAVETFEVAVKTWRSSSRQVKNQSWHR